MTFIFPHYLRVALFSLLLAGCAHQLPRAPLISEDWPKHQNQIEALKNWQVVGKLGIRVPNDGGSLSLRWSQQLSDYQIHFNSPLGQNVLTIEGSAKAVTLREAGKEPTSAKTAEELIMRNTGWTIPVTQLAYWIRGLPAPGAKITAFKPNPQGLIGEFEQLEWKVTFSNYLSVNTANDTIAMPGRIIAEYKDIRLTLAIREWVVGQVAAQPQ